MKKLILFFVGLFLVFSSVFGQKANSEQYVVMLSLDGFRADYVEKYNAKNLKKIAQNGVRAMRMIPSNPTKTFPNHYSLVTGLYPDHHGLVNNGFYAPDLKKNYAVRDRKSVENGKFYGGEPIWVTAEKAGLVAASYFWVGSEAAIQGISPTIWKRYNGKTTFEAKIDSVINWLGRPDNQRPRIITMYHHEPDKTGHIFGPNAPETKKKVQEIDSLVGILYDRLMKLPIADKLNFIVVADHGMRELSKDRVVYLDKYIKKEWLNNVGGGNPVYHLYAKENKKDSVYEAIKKIPHIHIFRNGKVSKKLKFGNNARMGDFIIIGEKGWSVFSSFGMGRKFGGTHGFLNTDEQMSAVFIGAGSGLKQGVSRKFIRNVDVYNLVTKLLGITPAPNDGKYCRIKKFVKK